MANFYLFFDFIHTKFDIGIGNIINILAKFYWNSASTPYFADGIDKLNTLYINNLDNVNNIN